MPPRKKMSLTEDASYNFPFFMKVWVPMTAAVVVTLLSMQGWMASHYFSAQDGVAIEHRVAVIEATTSKVLDQNDMIIEKLGYVSGILAGEQ